MTISGRLLALSRYLRGVPLYDVGTDHAILPVYAVSELGVPWAEASDIRREPLEKAKRNIAKAGLESRIRTVLRDGLGDADLPDPCDVVIAGMGGENIAGIIDGCAALAEGDRLLLLQPMTRAGVLREFLAVRGFDILRELAVYDGRLYEIIIAKYSGVKRTVTAAEAAVGDPALHDDRGAFLRLAGEKIARAKKEAAGKLAGGIDTEQDEKLIEELETLMKGMLRE